MNDTPALTDLIVPRIGLPASRSMVTLTGTVTARLYDANGVLVGSDYGTNIVPNVGLQYILENDVMATTLYVGLLANSPSLSSASTGATITLTDVPFSESVRPTWTKTRTAQTASNSASLARFSFTGAGTTGLGGAFISASSTKADATAANLIACRAFTAGNLGAVASGYTLDIQYDIALSSS
jgi:hypothetical protein